jgi:hypothetical protein
MTAPRRNLARHKLGNAKHGGWIPDRPKAAEDWLLEKKLGARRQAAPENPQCDPAYYPLIKDQGNLGSCTGKSASLGVEYCVIEKLAGEGQNVTSDWWQTWALSGLAGYYWARKIEKTIREDSGAQIRDAVDGIRRNGLPTEASWPYKPSKFAQKPDARAMKTAPWHHLDGLKTYRCDGAGGSREETLTNMLRALEIGMPVNFGFSCPADWGDYNETGRIPMPNGKYDGGHAVLTLRADTKNRFLMGPNTWGDKIGGPQPEGSRIATEGGKGWFALPFDYVLSGDADDAWALSLK